MDPLVLPAILQSFFQNMQTSPKQPIKKIPAWVIPGCSSTVK